MSLMTDPRVAYATAGGTTGTGLGTWMDWIPNDIGKLATLVGICLSITILIIHWRKELRDTEARERARQEEDLRQELLRAQIEQVRQDE